MKNERRSKEGRSPGFLTPMNVLILANGDPPSSELLAGLADSHDLFIACDGAVQKAVACAVLPDVVSGDFDSLDLDAARAALPRTEFVATPDQSRTDLEKAVEIARARGATALTIAGAAGGRIDHTLGNASLLLRWAMDWPDLPVAIVADGAETRALLGTRTLDTEAGDAVSVLSLDGQARVTLAGVRWPLTDFLLAVGVGGLLNEATGASVTVKAEGGVILVCHLQAYLRQLR